MQQFLSLTFIIFFIYPVIYFSFPLTVLLYRLHRKKEKIT